MPTWPKDTGKFLTVDDVTTGDEVEFTDEGQEVEKEFKGKKSKKIEIGVRLPNGDEKTATLNATSRNLLVDHYGMNPLTGEKGRVDIVRVNVSGEMKKVIYICPPNMDFEGNVVVK